MGIKNFGKYKVVRASALAQMEVLSLLSSHVIVNWGRQSKPIDNPVDDFLLLFVTALPFAQKQKMVELLMSEVSDSDGVYVDIESFNGKMMEWHKLIAQVLYWNLDDFFTYIDTVHRADLSKLNQQVQ